MTKPGGRMPPGECGTEGQTRSRQSRRRVRRGVATERREGEVDQRERSPHRSDRAETGRRERSGGVGTRKVGATHLLAKRRRCAYLTKTSSVHPP